MSAYDDLMRAKAIVDAAPAYQPHIEGRPITLAEIGPIHLNPDAVSRPPTKDLGLETPCEGCGHDADRHRRGRCWTDWQGEPVHRARTQIDCNCQEATR